jgi:ATP-dependent RNA helicase DDX56/DBP9
MKRKLDENDRPSVPQPEGAEKAASTEEEFSFTELGLDPRLLQAVAKLKFEKPTLVQRKAIPLALAGQDVLCKAKTGSGKTAAYVLPIIASILKRKQVCPSLPLHTEGSPANACADGNRSRNFHTRPCADPRASRSSIQGH